jgi:Uma2 family endonuclease
VGGWVGVESGFVLEQNPDSVRGPDIAYVCAERIPSTGIPQNFWPLFPDLVVEMISPSERIGDIEQKVSDYLRAGTRLVWLVYPTSRRVFAYSPDDEIRIFKAEDLLEDQLVLPGFGCRVGDIFR